MQSVAERAVDALFLTLGDKLPGILRAADAERRALVRAPAGPYLIPEGEIAINGSRRNVPGGLYTAAELADVLGAGATWETLVEVTGAVSRVVFRAASGPLRDRPSGLRFGAGKVADAIGVGPDKDLVEIAAADPAPRLLAREPEQVNRLDRPLVFFEDATTLQRGPSRSGIHVVTIRLAVWSPGDPLLPPEATLRKAQAIERGIARAIDGGDDYGPSHVGGSGEAGRGIIRAAPSRFVARAKAWAIQEAGDRFLPLAVVNPEIEVLVQAF